MSKLVTVNVKDAAGLPTFKTEEVVMNDAIVALRDAAVFVTDDDGIFFQRQLEHIQAQSYDFIYPDLKGRSIFSNNTEGGEGINAITYRAYNKRGEAEIIAGKATDLPRADIDGQEYSIFVKTIGAAYGYSRQELASAKLTGLPLDARKAEAVRRVYEEKINKLIWFGDSVRNLGGLFGGKAGEPWSTIPNNAVAGASGGSNSTVWGVDKTPDEVIADLTGACATMYADSLMLHSPNKILMSVTKYNYIMNTPRSIHSDTSILDWFLKNNDFITSRDQIEPVNELAGIFGATPGQDTGDAEGFVVLEMKEENLRTREPYPLVHLPVQYKGLEFEVNCYGRFAGLEIIRPQAVSLNYGV
jgi:hypothetical protein